MPTLLCHAHGTPLAGPVVYFRLLLLGYLLGTDSERGIALTVSDSLGLREAGLANKKTVPVATTMLFAKAALRTLRHKDSQEGFREFLEGLVAVTGVPTPTLAELAAFDRKRKEKTLPNQEWESPTDPDARVAKMKDGATHLEHKAEHAVDLEAGALVGVTVQAKDQGDAATLGAMLEAVKTAQVEGPGQVVADD